MTDERSVQWHRTRRPIRSLLAGLATLAVATGLLAAPTAAYADPLEDAVASLCAAPAAARAANEQQVAAHNARPHVFGPGQEALLAEYDAEAAELQAARTALTSQLQECLASARAAFAPSSDNSYVPDLSTGKRSIARLTAIPRPETIPTPTIVRGPGNVVTVPKDPYISGVYSALRTAPGRSFPRGAVLSGAARPKPGDADPAFPGTRFDSSTRFSPDHIVPLAELVQLPGFGRLSPTAQWLIVRAPVNYQWMSTTANMAKSSATVARVSGADPRWVAEQVALQNSVRKKLLALIRSSAGE